MTELGGRERKGSSLVRELTVKSTMTEPGMTEFTVTMFLSVKLREIEIAPATVYGLLANSDDYVKVVG